MAFVTLNGAGGNDVLVERSRVVALVEVPRAAVTSPSSIDTHPNCMGDTIDAKQGPRTRVMLDGIGGLSVVVEGSPQLIARQLRVEVMSG